MNTRRHSVTFWRDVPLRSDVLERRASQKWHFGETCLSEVMFWRDVPLRSDIFGETCLSEVTFWRDVPLRSDVLERRASQKWHFGETCLSEVMFWRDVPLRSDILERRASQKWHFRETFHLFEKEDLIFSYLITVMVKQPCD